MTNGVAIARDIIAESERIEREKEGHAITPDEAQMVKAAACLRKFAPYLFHPVPADSQK